MSSTSAGLASSRRRSSQSERTRTRQPRRARALILRHPDRVLFGTDLIPPERKTYEIYFRFLETEDEYFSYSPSDPPPTGRWCISALDLPADVLRLVYSENARTLIPGLGH